LKFQGLIFVMFGSAIGGVIAESQANSVQRGKNRSSNNENGCG